MNKEIEVPFFSDRYVNKTNELLNEIAGVLESRHLILGKKVNEFENNFSKFLGASHCVSVANGTDALEIALRALEIKQGDKVATVANAGFYASTAIHQIGAVPVYIEMDPKTFLISIKDLKNKIETEKVTAVVITHLYGLPADVTEIAKLARSKGIFVIEDCAQAHGLKIEDKFAGTIGDISTFSFYPTKNLGAIGDGGAIVTNNDQLAEKAKKLRQYGWYQKYDVEIIFGRNSRLDEIQAAVLCKKLKDLNINNDVRKQAAGRYLKNLADFPIQFSTLLQEGVAHLLPIVIEHRDKLVRYLADQGIQTAIHYPIPDHKQSAYQNKLNLPITEKFCETVMSLPLFPGISNEEIDFVCEKIGNFYESR